MLCEPLLIKYVCRSCIWLGLKVLITTVIPTLRVRDYHARRVGVKTEDLLHIISRRGVDAGPGDGLIRLA